MIEGDKLNNPNNKAISEDPIREAISQSPVAYFLVLVTLMIMGTILGTVLVKLIEGMTGLSLQEVFSQVKSHRISERNLLRWASIATHVAKFTIPAIITVWLLERGKWTALLKINQLPRQINLLLGILFMLFCYPLAQFGYWFNQQIPLPEWAAQLEASANELLSVILQMPVWYELYLNIIVMAVVPAIGEEFVFRGILQQKLGDYIKPKWVTVWITALIFSAFHLQFEGFLPRLILGAGLGYLMLWTKNLWIPIIAHFFINGFQLLITYFRDPSSNQQATFPDEIPVSFWPAFFIATILTLLIGFLLERINSKQTVTIKDDPPKSTS